MSSHVVSSRLVSSRLRSCPSRPSVRPIYCLVRPTLVLLISALFSSRLVWSCRLRSCLVFLLVSSCLVFLSSCLLPWSDHGMIPHVVRSWRICLGLSPIPPIRGSCPDLFLWFLFPPPVFLLVLSSPPPSSFLVCSLLFFLFFVLSSRLPSHINILCGFWASGLLGFWGSAVLGNIFSSLSGWWGARTRPLVLVLWPTSSFSEWGGAYAPPCSRVMANCVVSSLLVSSVRLLLVRSVFFCFSSFFLVPSCPVPSGLAN